MTSERISAAIFSLATVADLRSTALRLEQIGAAWVNLPLLDVLWAASDPGSRSSELRNYRPGFGALITPATEVLGGFRLERQTDPGGRNYIARRLCVVSSADAKRFAWDFGLLRSFWMDDLPVETSVVEIPVDLPPESKRRADLVTLLQDRQRFDLFMWLLQAISQETLPVALSPGVLSTEDVPVFAEALQLVLPRIWRIRFSFASGLCVAGESTVSVRFMALPYWLQDVRTIRPDDAPQFGEPVRDYSRLVRDAIKDGWLDDL